MNKQIVSKMKIMMVVLGTLENSEATMESNTNPQNQNNDNSNNTSSNNQADQFKKAIDVFADASNHILSTVGWVAQQLNAPGNVFRMSDALGQTAEITLSIPAAGTGEIVVLLGKSRRYYAAKSKDPHAEIKRGSKVKIVDIAVSTMYVEPILTES